MPSAKRAIRSGCPAATCAATQGSTPTTSARTGPPGHLGGDLGDLGEGRRRGRGERHRAVVRAVRRDDHRGGLGRVLAGGPGHRSVGGHGDDAGLAPRADEPVEAVRVEAVAQRGPGQPRGREQLLGPGVVAPRAEGGVEGRALVARVEDAADPGRHGGVDRGPVQGHRVGAGVARGDEQQLVGAGEGGRQRGRVGVVGPAHVDARLGEPRGAGGVAHGHDELGGRRAGEQVVDGGAVEGAGRSGDDDHGGSFGSSGSA